MIKEIHIVYSEDSNLNADDLLAQSRVFQEKNIAYYPYFGKQEFKASFTNNQNLLLEYIVKKSNPTNIDQDRGEFLQNFQSCLQIMDVSNELIIIDPYFLKKKPNESLEEVQSRLDLFEAMISQVKNGLTMIRIITAQNNINRDYEQQFRVRMQSINPNIEISHHCTNEIHDRFWINPINKKGLVIGTSLNGILKKYSFFDNLRDDDVGEILEVITELFPNLLH
ncbi:hypothetical protein [Acinetobacter tandoii]|uniref:hypothetical protein n=1 Tax=Acinetobacter tandoii TaxID=202954 RepID=UPI003016156B